LPFLKGKGKLEKIKKIFEFSAVPSRRAEFKNYSQRNSFEPFASPPAACGKLGNILLNISCEPVLSFGHDRHPHDAISVEKVKRMVE